MRHRIVSLVLALALSACTDGVTAPAFDHLVGTYTYEARIPLRVGLTNERIYRGAMAITFASADSLDGLFEGVTVEYPAFGGSIPIRPGLKRDFVYLFVQSGTHRVYARPVEGGQIMHAFRPTASGLSCEEARMIFASSSDIQAVVGTCTIVKR